MRKKQIIHILSPLPAEGNGGQDQGDEDDNDKTKNARRFEHIQTRPARIPIFRAG